MKKYMRKTKRRRSGIRTRKRGGDNNNVKNLTAKQKELMPQNKETELMPWNNASIASIAAYRQEKDRKRIENATKPSLSTQAAIANTKRVSEQLSHEREQLISKIITKELIQNAANAAKKAEAIAAANAAEKAEAIAAANAAKKAEAEANAKVAKDAALQATVHKLMSKGRRPIINIAPYVGKTSRMSQNKGLAEYLAAQA